MSKKTPISIIICGLAGIGLSSYLWYLDSQNVLPYCPISNCEEVLASKYSSFLGLAIAGWGTIFYTIITILGLLHLLITKRSIKILLSLSVLFGVFFTLYLRYIEFFILKKICMWCWGSVMIVGTLTVLVAIENLNFIKKTYKKLFRKNEGVI